MLRAMTAVDGELPRLAFPNDVPVLDGVALIDPKRSMVDIIQAVGRVIRTAAGKPIGTLVIPVFIDESEDADHVLSQSAFEPVWQVHKALRAHDRRLADELDQLRLSFLGSLRCNLYGIDCNEKCDDHE